MGFSEIFPLAVWIGKGVVKQWVLIPCFRTNIQWMNVAAVPQLTTAVVCSDLSGCMEEKMVAGTLNSLGFPTFWTIRMSREEVANTAVGLLFKNLFFWRRVLHHQALCALPFAFLSSSCRHLQSSGACQGHYPCVLSHHIWSSVLLSYRLSCQPWIDGLRPWHQGRSCTGWNEV